MPAESVPILYGNAGSSCTARLRIALNLKGIKYDAQSVDVRMSVEYQKLNPQRLVPLYVTKEASISQSVAILEYLDETAQGPALLPKDARGRARVRSIAQFIVSEIQSLQNTRLDDELTKLGADLLKWRLTWIVRGFDAIEGMLDSSDTGKFCHGDEPTIADCCLIPQIINNTQRYQLDSARWPKSHAIFQHAVQLKAFADALPQNQPGFPGF